MLIVLIENQTPGANKLSPKSTVSIILLQYTQKGFAKNNIQSITPMAIKIELQLGIVQELTSDDY